MNVHLFGKKDSPCCANWALRKSVDEETQEIKDAVCESFYMDDYLDSMMTEKIAANHSCKLINLIADGGFNLTKWMSNSKDVLVALPSTNMKHVIDLDLDKLPVERALGMLWDPNEDIFTFNTVKKAFPLSKRGILSCISSVFDPLGILAPALLQGKLIVQQLWQLGIDWDSEVPSKEKKDWIEWKENIPNLSRIKLDRWLGFDRNCSVQLHIFSDASSLAYGAVAFARVVKTDTVWVSFLMGKSRLAPLGSKTMTIPKLELQAAVLAVRLKKAVIESVRIEFEKVIFWSDSQIVLKWLQNEERKFPVFVMNRLNEIRSSTDISSWKFVPGELNPADEATRYNPTISTSSRWLCGPSFLLEDEQYWPRNDVNNNKECSIEDTSTINVNVIDEVNCTSKYINETVKWNHYSSWIKLVRHITWIIKLKRNWLNHQRNLKNRENLKYLTVKEITETKTELYKMSQKESFPVEYTNLSQHKVLPKRSKLIPLRPFMEDGLLRVGGRIGLAHVPYDWKHQIVISPRHFIAELLVMHVHENNFHVGRNSTLALTRERYWIISGKSFVRSLIYKCSLCKRRRVEPVPPLMGNLPIDRLAYNEPPFSRTGVDYFGPLYVKRGRRTRQLKGTEKRYGALFTCMTTRAVHIELAGELSTDSFILALHRFISRRGNPKTISSDNGSNFVGAERELSTALQKLDQNRIRNDLSKRDIEWKFNPPASPWMGGAWESLVKSTKKALKTVVKDRLLTDEALQTFLTEVECTVNSRPLTSTSSDLDDYEALTPNHFLIGRPSAALPTDFVKSEDIDSKKRWRAVQAASHMFWNRWLKEYLPTLNKRQKWFTQTRNFQTGDLVLLTDRNVIKSHWNLGRILKTYPGKDDVTRVAEVKTIDGTYIRPTASLALLEEHQQ